MATTVQEGKFNFQDQLKFFIVVVLSLELVYIIMYAYEA